MAKPHDIITRYLSPTAMLAARIKASCNVCRAKATLRYDEAKTLTENGIAAATELRFKFPWDCTPKKPNPPRPQTKVQTIRTKLYPEGPTKKARILAERTLGYRRLKLVFVLEPSLGIADNHIAAANALCRIHGWSEVGWRRRMQPGGEDCYHDHDPQGVC